jgi:hypothetical protein
MMAFRAREGQRPRGISFNRIPCPQIRWCGSYCGNVGPPPIETPACGRTWSYRGWRLDQAPGPNPREVVAPNPVAAEADPSVRDLAISPLSRLPSPKPGRTDLGCCPTRNRAWVRWAPNREPPADRSPFRRPYIYAPSGRQSRTHRQIAGRAGGGIVAHVFRRRRHSRSLGQGCQFSCHLKARIDGCARCPIERRRCQ